MSMFVVRKKKHTFATLALTFFPAPVIRCVSYVAISINQKVIWTKDIMFHSGLIISKSLAENPTNETNLISHVIRLIDPNKRIMLQVSTND